MGLQPRCTKVISGFAEILSVCRTFNFKDFHFKNGFILMEIDSKYF
jgi:hypothetical protein